MDKNQSLELPALRGDLATFQPVISVDSREQSPLKFTRLKSRVVTLPTGDYGLLGCERAAVVERKGSLDELITCLTVDRVRFARELQRMRAYPFRRLAVIGSRTEVELQRYRSRATPRSVLNTLAAFEVRFDLPICYFRTPEEMARQTESWLFWVARQVLKDSAGLLKAAAQDDKPEEGDPQ